MSRKEDFINATRPIWLLGQAFGLCFSSATTKIVNKKPSKSRKLGRFTYWTISIACTVYLSVFNFQCEIDPGKNVVIQAGDILNGTSSIAAALGCILTSCYYENRLVTVMKDLHEVNKQLRKYRKEISYKRVKRFMYVALAFTFNSWLCFLIVFITTCKSHPVDCFWTWVLMFTITKVFDVNLTRFLGNISIVYQQLCIVNGNITLLAEEKVTSWNLIKELQRINTLDTLKELYDEVLRIGEEINNIYSFSLLLIIANQFISIFSALYNCLFGYYIDGNYIEPNSLQTLFVPLLSLIHPGGQLLATAIICQLTISESQHTGKIIYQIPINRNHKTLMRRITLFSLHILHKEFDITANGFFSVNCSLLLMIVGAVTVYLVMFIQFDLASRKQIDEN